MSEERYPGMRLVIRKYIGFYSGRLWAQNFSSAFASNLSFMSVSWKYLSQSYFISWIHIMQKIVITETVYCISVVVLSPDHCYLAWNGGNKFRYRIKFTHLYLWFTHKEIPYWDTYIYVVTCHDLTSTNKPRACVVWLVPFSWMTSG